MTDIQLTANESAILAAWDFNYDTADQEKEDNSSVMTVEDLAKATGKSVASVKATMGSLTKKDVVNPDDVNGKPVFYLSEDGIDMAFSLINADNQEDNTMQDGMDKAIDEMIAEEHQPKKKAKKKETKPKEEKPTKPEPKTLMGAEITEDADVEAIEREAKEIAPAFEAIGRKDADLLGHYLSLGKFQSRVAPMFKGPKAYGKYLAKAIPESSKLDPALRSNCKWVYEALNKEGHEAYGDFLATLGVNRIEDYKSQNPTVIVREYKKAKKAAEAKAKAQELGIDVKEGDEVKELSKREREEEKAKLESLLKRFCDALETRHKKVDIAQDAHTVLHKLLIDGKKGEAIELMESLS